MASHSNNQHTGVLVGQLNYKTYNNIGIMTAIKLTWDDWKKENIEITLLFSIEYNNQEQPRDQQRCQRIEWPVQ